MLFIKPAHVQTLHFQSLTQILTFFNLPHFIFPLISVENLIGYPSSLFRRSGQSERFGMKPHAVCFPPQAEAVLGTVLCFWHQPFAQKCKTKLFAIIFATSPDCFYFYPKHSIVPNVDTPYLIHSVIHSQKCAVLLAYKASCLKLANTHC